MRVTAVADAIPEAALSLSARTGAQVTQAQALTDSPTDSHYDQIHAAARAGKATFCEKPGHMSADLIRACITVAKGRRCALSDHLQPPL